MEVRTFESDGLKSAPQRRKNLNPIKLGHVVDETESEPKTKTGQFQPQPQQDNSETHTVMYDPNFH
jgi:hypothetical protein